jgi:hypothetical protein
VERDAPESGSLGGDAGILGGCLPLVEGQRRRSVTQVERHEIWMVLVGDLDAPWETDGNSSRAAIRRRARPSALGPRELEESGCSEERSAVRLFRPRICEEPVGPRETQPSGGL